MATYLPGVLADPKPGPYRDLIEQARRSGTEYGRIWELFAFQSDFTVHLGRFTHGVLRQPATISAGLRELVAAYTSYQNDCGFCTQAHAAAAAELLGSEELVWQALRDVEGAPLDDKTKALFRPILLNPLQIVAARLPPPEAITKFGVAQPNRFFPRR